MILPLEKQVSSLEPSKRLKELGVKQESEFCWEEQHIVNNQEPMLFFNSRDPRAEAMWETCSAFTVAELIQWISDRQNEWAIGYNDSGCFWRFKSGERGCGSMMEGFGHNYSSDDAESLVDALSEYVIYLIKEKGFKP